EAQLSNAAQTQIPSTPAPTHDGSTTAPAPAAAAAAAATAAAPPLSWAESSPPPPSEMDTSKSASSSRSIPSTPTVLPAEGNTGIATLADTAGFAALLNPTISGNSLGSTPLLD